MSNVSQFIGSGWVPLETIELTGAVNTVDFDSNIDDTFNNYVVTGTHTLSINTAAIYCKLKTGDPSATINAGYRFLQTYPSSITNNSTNTPSSFARISLYSGSFIAYFMNLRSSDQFKSIVTQATGYLTSSGIMSVWDYTNALLDTSIINGIQIYPSSGDINTGSKFTLYGIKEL
jgi:hypothetical protein